MPSSKQKYLRKATVTITSKTKTNKSSKCSIKSQMLTQIIFPQSFATPIQFTIFGHACTIHK